MDIRLVNWGHESCRPGHSYGPAVRDHYLIHYVESGRGYFTCHGKKITVSAGQGFIIMPGDVTFYQADQTDPWQYRWIGYAGPDAHRLTQEAGLEGQAVFTAGPMAELNAILVQAEHDIAAFASPRRGEMCALGSLYRFLFMAGAGQTTEMFDPQTAQEQLYEKACWFLRANFGRSVTISEAAAFVGLSRSQLFRIFKAVGGISPAEHLQHLRLTQVRSLLRDTDFPINAIALSCGFSSTAHLCAVFRQAYGMTPGAYRALREKRF